MYQTDISIESADIATRAAIANRLRRCLPPVKADIAAWAKSGVIPSRSLEFDVDGTITSISPADLVNIYGYEPILAFIYFDDLVAANLDPDKRRLIDLLTAIPFHGARHTIGLNLSPEMLDQIRTANPDLWAEYTRIRESEPS